jgi:alkylation response protein AidB-like acyl-CoA dehydrogenase
MTTAAPEWTNTQILERARSLATVFAEEAEASEIAREPSARAVAALHESGLLRLMLPRAHGGLERDIDLFVEVGLVLARADASLAWVTSFLVEHVWWFTQFPECFQKEIFAEGPPAAAGVVSPSARLEAVDGGYRVNGHWGWASGSSCSDWLLAGGIEESSEAGGAGLRLLALPMAEVERIDNWHVDGMCATASNDMVVSQAFVPAARSLPFADLMNATGPGAKLYDGPLYRTPAMPILMTAVVTTALGQAMAALDLYRDEAGRKVRGIGPPEREKPLVQHRIGRAELELRKARLLLQDVTADVMQQRNEAATPTRARWIACYDDIAHTSRRVILEISRAAGASAHFRSHPLQRMVRDVNTLASHFALNEDANLESLGRILLGLDASSPLL